MRRMFILLGIFLLTYITVVLGRLMHSQLEISVFYRALVYNSLD